MRLLDRLQEGNRVRFLNRLSRRVKERLAQSVLLLPNTIAAFDILTNFNQSLPSLPIIQELNKRPLERSHTYFISIVSEIVSDPNHRIQCADAVSDIIRDVLQIPSETQDDWHGRLVIQGFHVLSAIQPESLFGAIAQKVPEVDDVRLTAVLESIVDAAHKLDSIPNSDRFRETVELLWRRYANQSTEASVLNAPGVSARLLELFGHLGDHVDELIDKARHSASPTQTLYLLTQRHLDFLSPEDRVALYAATMVMLQREEHRMAIQKLVEVIFTDKDLPFESLGRIFADAT